MAFIERTSILTVHGLVLMLFLGKGTSDWLCPKGMTNITGVTSGELVYPSSGTYGINETRCWRIEVPKPYVGIGIYYHSYEIEECSSCGCDVVAYGSDYGRFMAILCRKYSPRHGEESIRKQGKTPNAVVPGVNAYFYFRSDSTVQEKGFNFSFIAVSSDRPRIQASYLNASDDETFVFNTPKYGSKNYPAYFAWQWYLIVPEGRQVQLSFDAFKLEQSNNCENDYLEVRETNKYGAILVKPSCGTNNPGTIQSAGNKVWVHFRSDFNASSTDKGFKASFKAGQGRLSALNSLMLLLISSMLMIASRDSVFQN